MSFLFTTDTEWCASHTLSRLIEKGFYLLLNSIALRMVSLATLECVLKYIYIDNMSPVALTKTENKLDIS